VRVARPSFAFPAAVVLSPLNLEGFRFPQRAGVGARQRDPLGQRAKAHRSERRDVGFRRYRSPFRQARGNGMNKPPPLAIGLVALMVLTFGVGFLCFGVVLTYAVNALIAEHGFIYAAAITLGGAVGLLPIAFLFDRQEALKRQQQRCPHCGTEPGSQSPSGRFSVEIEGHASHPPREGR